jgi:hypothetical protein
LPMELLGPVEQSASLGPHQISGITRHTSLNELPKVDLGRPGPPSENDEERRAGEIKRSAESGEWTLYIGAWSCSCKSRRGRVSGSQGFRRGSGSAQTGIAFGDEAAPFQPETTSGPAPIAVRVPSTRTMHSAATPFRSAKPESS